MAMAKRKRSSFIGDDEHEHGGSHRRPEHERRPAVADFFDLEVEVDDDDEGDEEELGDDDFINDGGAELLEEDIGRRPRHSATFIQDEQEEDIDEFERQVKERYAKSSYRECDEEATDVGQQALLPSVEDAKLWMVKCAIGHERETAICLMQKFIDKPGLHIKSVIVLDHLKNYIYVEAYKEAHVKDACKGLRNIYSSAKATLVPIKEMTGVLSGECKVVDLFPDTWVRMKIGVYKGDLAKVIDVDSVQRKVTVKIIPRIDLRTLANKLEGREVGIKKAFVPPPHFFSIGQARKMHINIERRRDRESGEHFDMVGGLKFKDGFLYKTVSMKSITSQNIQPTFDEVDKFQELGGGVKGGIASLSTLSTNSNKDNFVRDDTISVISGDLKALIGSVQEVDGETVHVKFMMPGLPKTVAFNVKELQKYFKIGDHVKVVSGVEEGATGMVIKVEGCFLIILSDITNEHIRVSASHVMESSGITTEATRMGDYELHDLVLLDNMSFGVIIHVAAEAFKVLEGIPHRPSVVLVKPREIKMKIQRQANALDRYNHLVSVNDVVRVIEGSSKGRQGRVDHVYNGILFIYEHRHLEHSGFICAKSLSCVLIGGSHRSPDRSSPGRPPRDRPLTNSGGRIFSGPKGCDPFIGKTIKIRSGQFKGYRGIVKGLIGTLVRVELESQMKIVTVNGHDISVASGAVSTPFRETLYGLGSETPMCSSRTPLRTCQTPMRDRVASPIHAGMRTPSSARAWAPDKDIVV